MIKTQDKLFANLVKQRHLDLPLEPLTRVVNLAAVALGVLRSKSLQVGQIIPSLPLEGIRDSLKKRVQRFLKNSEVEVYQEPVARRILQRLVEGGARVHLILPHRVGDVQHSVCQCGVARASPAAGVAGFGAWGLEFGRAERAFGGRSGVVA